MILKIRNIVGTSDEMPPNGYDSWIDFWKTKKGRNPYSCSNINCNNQNDLVGAHVRIIGNYADGHRYIIPLCKECNNSNDPIIIDSEDLVFLD